MIFTPIADPSMASLAMFSTVFKTKEKHYRRFRSKVSEDIFPEICYRYDLLEIGPRVVQFSK